MECNVCIIPDIGKQCNVCKKPVCHRCINEVLKFKDNISIICICSLNCLYEYIFSSQYITYYMNRILDDSQTHIFKKIIYEDQRDKQKIIMVNNKKWIAWTNTYVIQYLIKDITTIVMYYI